MIIAIDYDGTITDDATNTITRDSMIYIPELAFLGCTLVLWSARKKEAYEEALDKLNDCGLLKYFTPISQCEIGYCGKLIADVYLDDRCGHEFNWQQSYDYIKNNLTNE